MTTQKNYITSVELQSYFVDKLNGFPLAGGYVEFFKDSNRVVGKNVYQKQQNGFDISGNPLYEYVSLGNVVQLSGVGTFMDNDGNDIAVYYYPWDANGNLELYYIAVFSADGTPQFTREGWPDSFATDNPDISDSGGFENQISNPQFVAVNFDPSATLTIDLTGNATTTIEIAPDWNLVVTHTATTTIAVQRTAIAGSSNFPTQAPFYLTVTPGSSITAVKLVQQLTNNPGIWSAVSAGTGGYVASSITLGPSTPTTKIIYTPSTGTATQLLSENNPSSTDYEQFKATVQLAPSDNPTTATTGYVSIVIELSATAASTLSSVQVIGMNGNFQDVDYEQITANRQIDHLFNYYKTLLEYKPINSYLIGWDFPLNPAQFGSTIGVQGTGANTSNYFWDQTIVFQSENVGVSAARGSDGSLVLTAATDTKLALVQYLEAPMANEILTNYLSSNLRAFTDNVNGIPCTISLWYTTDAQLPNVAGGTSKSLVISLDANGFPTCGTGASGFGTWTKVARSNLGDVKFTLAQGTTYSDYGYTRWKDTGSASTTATYVAIVIGFGTLSSGKKITIQSASLVPGKVATIPAPKSISEVLHDCNRYYWDTFPVNVAAGDNKGLAGALGYTVQVAGTAAGYTIPVVFPAQMRTTPLAFYYNPSAGTSGKWYNAGRPGDSGTAVTSGSIGVEAVNINNPQVGGGADVASNAIYIHAAFEARLGVVL